MKQFLLLLAFFLFFSACTNNSESTPEKTPAKETFEKSSSKKPTTSVSGTSSIDSLNNFIKANPDARSYAERAAFYLERKQMQAALLDVNKALAIDSNLAKAHEVLGGMAYIQNKTRQARDEWTQCAKLDKKNLDCRIALAELYIAVKNYKPAIKVLKEATAIDDRNATVYMMKGVVSRDFNNDTVLALNYFQKAVDIEQNNLDALDLMAVTLGNLKDTTAEFYYKRMLKLAPNRADIYYKLGVLYMGSNQPNRALEAYSKAIQLNPGDAQSYYNLGYMHIDLKLYNQAAEFFTKAINAKSRYYQAYYGRGYAYEMLGNVSAAEADYNKSLELLPIYSPAKVALARMKEAEEIMKKSQKK